MKNKSKNQFDPLVPVSESEAEDSRLSGCVSNLYLSFPLWIIVVWFIAEWRSSSMLHSLNQMIFSLCVIPFVIMVSGLLMGIYYKLRGLMRSSTINFHLVLVFGSLSVLIIIVLLTSGN